MRDNPAVSVMIMKKKTPPQVQQGSVKTSFSVTPATASEVLWLKMFTFHIHHHLHLYILLHTSPFKTPQILPLKA